MHVVEDRSSSNECSSCEDITGEDIFEISSIDKVVEEKHKYLETYHLLY